MTRTPTESDDAPRPRPDAERTAYTRILTGYDGTEHARDAEVLAEALVRATGASLTVVNAFYDVPTPLPADRLRPELRDHAERVLEEVSHHLPPELSVRKQVIKGRSPARALYEFAERAGADVVVLGSSHRAAQGRVAAGSVATQVLDSAPCAVAVAPAGLRHGGEPRLQRIGVGYDGHPEAQEALAAAASLARATGARLHIMVAIEHVGTTLMGPMAAEAHEVVRASMRTAREEALRRAVDAAGGPDHSDGVLLEGQPADVLAAEAEKSSVDLLVVGSRGFGPIRRVLLGSTSAKLMRSAPCALLVVPRRAAAGGAS